MWKKRRISALFNKAGVRSFLSRISLNSIIIMTLIPDLMIGDPVITYEPEPVSRLVDAEVTVMTNHWQLANWSDGNQVCEMFLEHDQWPAPAEVWTACGYEVMEEWISTPTCSIASGGGSSGSCKGLLLHYMGQTPVTYIEAIELPGIGLEITPLNCTPGEWCETRPLVEVNALEPLDGYAIRNVHVRSGNRKKVYNGDEGRFNLPITDEQGAWLEYWAESTYGDWSDTIRVKYRCIMNEDGTAFHFDLLGGEWDTSAASGSALWQLFPPVDGSLPLVLHQPQSAGDLFTAEPYVYLGGNLIRSGEVDASGCPDGGLNINGTASECGKDAGIRQIVNWQNKYDAQIYQAAQNYNVPPRVLKAIIAQELQFWPVSNDPYEIGLGYITSDGADLLLTWDVAYYLDICMPKYGEDVCSSGYGILSDIHKTMLRRIVLDKIGTAEEIDVLAALLLASASQAGQMVLNTTRQEPVYTTNYVDMWKISVGNYYAGAGCIGNAMEAVVGNENAITWDNIAEQLAPECVIADDYVSKVVKTY